MRILGFSKKWDKLSRGGFTTFRYPRVDRDWQIGEMVQIAVQPRRKGGGDKLGIAQITNKEIREFDPYFKGKGNPMITEAEAIADGFTGIADMWNWMEKTYGKLDFMPKMNKLTLVWVIR